jgi:hypothetical protein
MQPKAISIAPIQEDYLVTRWLRQVWATLRVVTHRDFWWAEFFSSFALCTWSAINSLSPDALSSHNFWPLLMVAPERFWERFSLVVGLCQFMALISDLWWARAIAAMGATFLLGSIVLNFLQLGHYPPGAVGFYVAGLATNVMAMWKNIVRPGEKK